MNTETGPCTSCKKSEKWRDDFPIEWEGDNYVSRREMVKFLTLGSLFLAVANWITAFGSRILRRGSQSRQLLGLSDDLKVNGSTLFRYPTAKDPCIAVRTAEGKLVAYSQVCTHLSCAVVYDKSEQSLFCPCHNGRFNLEQGTPIAGPPTRPLLRIRLEESGGQIYAIEREA
jgi:nitrite reductase/ring-hydroxylating ferredoxin subunit